MRLHVESYTCGKHHERPEENEDRLVILPGLGYAVIDGVTDRSGRTYRGMRPGRYAADLVARRVTRYLAEQDIAEAGGEDRVRHLVDTVSAALHDAYRQQGVLDEAAARPDVRIGSTLALALHDGDMLRVVCVGDTGLRVTGAMGRILHVEEKPLDAVTALLRQTAWRHAEAQGQDRAVAMAWSEAAVRRGLATPPEGMSAAAAVELSGRVLDAAIAAHPRVARDELATLVARGISGQRDFANHPDRDLGYGVIDGFPVPDRHVVSVAYPLAEVDELEIFSDGYFALPDDFGVAAWEASFAAVEGADPDKVGSHPSTKGSTASAWTDDRTYVGVRFRAR